MLKTLAHTDEVQTYLESRHPQNPEYQALRVELEALKASEENEIVVDPKLLLKPGETSAELPKLLQIIARGLDDEFGGDYGETLATFGKSETYVPELVPVIKEVQKRAGLKPDGVDRPAHRRLARRHARRPTASTRWSLRWRSCAGCRPTSAARASSSTSRPSPSATSTAARRS